MLKLEGRCNICKQIKREYLEDGSSKLERRLYNCKKFTPGGESQRAICRDLGVSPISLNKHLTYHQNPDDNAIIERNMERNITIATSRNQMRNEMTEIGMQQLKEGEIKMNAATIRALLRDQDEIELKQKDQAIKVMETIFAFNSGELSPDTPEVIQGSIVESEE